MAKHLLQIDAKSRHISVFNSMTGFYVRTGEIQFSGTDEEFQAKVLGTIKAIEEGLEMPFIQFFLLMTSGKLDEVEKLKPLTDWIKGGDDPFMASYPSLIDVGIMGSCQHGRNGLCRLAGVECYQDGLNMRKPNMSLEAFQKIVDESKGRVYQIALGGRGDPNKHQNFKEICEYCRDNDIAPNFTTSGLALTDEEVEITKEFCGAVAISWYRQQHTYDAVQRFLDAGCITNIHYVLGNNSIDEAIERLEKNDFPKGITAVIFLLHKPVGLGTEENVLQDDDPRVARFFELVDTRTFDFQIGFDSCTIPGIINHTKNIRDESIDTCEGGRWSMYITSESIGLPCSFDNQDMRWAFDLKGSSIQAAWDSPQFDNFRSHFQNACPSCPRRKDCMGGCPIRNQIVLCDRKERHNEDS